MSSGFYLQSQLASYNGEIVEENVEANNLENIWDKYELFCSEHREWDHEKGMQKLLYISFSFSNYYPIHNQSFSFPSADEEVPK